MVWFEMGFLDVTGLTTNSIDSPKKGNSIAKWIEEVKASCGDIGNIYFSDGTNGKSAAFNEIQERQVGKTLIYVWATDKCYKIIKYKPCNDKIGKAPPIKDLEKEAVKCKNSEALINKIKEFNEDRKK